MVYPDARVYEGEWSGDRREGFGSLTYPMSGGGDRGRVRQYAGDTFSCEDAVLQVLMSVCPSVCLSSEKLKSLFV